MIRALVTGSLYGPPQARTSQAGKQYVTAKVRADGKDGAVVWCSVIAFGEQADRLMTLGDGGGLSRYFPRWLPAHQIVDATA